MAYEVNRIANALLRLAYNYEEDDLMTNLKLQKMLYYEQAYHLARFGTPLFEEEIEAWKYGPVIPAVYNRYASFQKQGIMPDLDLGLDFKDDSELELFFKVYEAYGLYSAYGLMELSHREKPWLEAIRNGIGTIISKESISDYFIDKIENGE